MEEQKAIAAAFWVLSVVISLILNFNFIGALIVKDWGWITDNWLSSVGATIVLVVYYLAAHFVLIFGFKNAISRFR